jgi:endonuclease/exonuclease/phosphatase family metal-dependent hydrolase
MLKLASWNIHRCIGSDGHYHPSRVRSVLRMLDADLVALQEVELFSHDPELLEFLCAGSQWVPVHGVTLERDSGRYGNAVLSRLPLRSVQRLDLSFGGREPRGVLDIHCALPGSNGAEQQLRVLATHFGLLPRERRRQASIVGKLLDAPALRPTPTWTVLMGDFNEWLLWGRPLRRLRRHFPPAPAPRTFPSRQPVFALDRIWMKGPFDGLKVTAVNTPETRRASDHLPLLAELQGETHSGVTQHTP